MPVAYRINKPVPPFAPTPQSGNWWQAETEFPQGTRLCLSGPSGSGKSSALRQLVGIAPPAPGTVFRGNQDMATVNAETLARYKSNSGIVLQDFHLLDNLSGEDNLRLRTATRNVAYPAPEVRVLADKLSIAPCLDKPVRLLSAGQKQRLALLRALLLPVSWLFLDEPFSNLDSVTRATATELIEAYIARHGCGLCFTTLHPEDDPFSCDACFTV